MKNGGECHLKHSAFITAKSSLTRRGQKRGSSKKASSIFLSEIIDVLQDTSRFSQKHGDTSPYIVPRKFNQSGGRSEYGLIETLEMSEHGYRLDDSKSEKSKQSVADRKGSYRNNKLIFPVLKQNVALCIKTFGCGSET